MTAENRATGPGELTDAQIGACYDRYLAHLVDDLPQDGRDYLRARYIESVRENPKALAGVAALVSALVADPGIEPGHPPL